jgi:hypothetical protein
MHGARGGAPKGNKNGWKHGGASAEARAMRKQVRELERMARQTLVDISKDLR